MISRRARKGVTHAPAQEQRLAASRSIFRLDKAQSRISPIANVQSTWHQMCPLISSWRIKKKKHLRPWLYMAVPYSLAFDGCWIMLWHAGAIGLHPAVSRKTSGVAMATNWSQSDAEALVTLVTLVQPFHPFILLHCLFFSDFWGFWYLLILTWSCLVSCVLAPSLEGDSEIRFGQLSRLVAQTWGTVRGTPEKNSDSLILSQ